MAFFSNSSESFKLDSQCNECRFGEKDCPIKSVQLLYDYEAAANETATNILEGIVSTKTGCQMFKKFEAVLSLPKTKDFHKF